MKAIDRSQIVASDKEIFVETYEKLLGEIAHISYNNPYYIMYFRGQSQDYLNSKGNSTIYPTIYRGTLKEVEIKNRFRLLDESARLLINVSKDYKINGITELKRKKQIQWSILQHYEVCDTPYLDITHSLRVACTFATLDNPTEYGYLYVLAFPYLTNRITINSEEDMLLIRLLSISPPDAKRPYYQEGFVTATTDITYDYENKNELDFKSRLVAKFKFPNHISFWGKDFSPLRRTFLYPNDDKFLKIADEVKVENKRGFKSNNIGDFLLLWNEFDESLRSYSEYNKHASLANILKNSRNMNYFSEIFYSRVKQLNSFRNTLVHSTKQVSGEEVDKQIINLKKIVDEFMGISNLIAHE